MLYMTEEVSTEEALHDVRRNEWHTPHNNEED